MLSATLLVAAAVLQPPRPLLSSPDVAIVRDVRYHTSNGSPLVMDLYKPATIASTERLPVLVVLNTIDASQRSAPFFTTWARAAAAHGFAAVIPDVHANTIEGDFDALMDYLGRHAADLQIDPARVAVHAASGNVQRAFPLVEDPKRTSVKAAVMYYGWGEVGTFRADLPVLYVRAGLDRPGVNEQIDSLVARALKENAPVTVLNYAEGHHGFEMADENAATDAVIAQTLQFLSTVMSREYRDAVAARRSEAMAAGAFATGDIERAVSLYADLVASRPGEATLRLSYGEALLAARRYKDARAQFAQLKDAGLGARDLALPAARAAVLDGDLDDAVAWLTRIPKRFLPRGLKDDPAFRALRDRADFRALFDP